MGYNLQVVAKTSKDRDLMFSFMQKNCESIRSMTGEVEARGKNKLAIEYSSCLHGEDRVLVYSIARWMALKIGALKGRYDKESVNPNKFDTPVPYVVYDGCESWPIFAFSSEAEAMEALPESIWWCATDKLGVYLGEKTSKALVIAASEAVFFSKERSVAFHEELAKKAGAMPEKSRDGWLKKRETILARHCAPDIRKMINKIRKEVDQLDKLWVTELQV